MFLFMFILYSVYFCSQRPTVTNLPGAQTEPETVSLQRTIMTFTCTDNVDAPTARLSVSPSTTPEFFRLQTTSSAVGATGDCFLTT